MARFLTYEDILATLRAGKLVRIDAAVKLTQLAQEFVKQHPEIVSRFSSKSEKEGKTLAEAASQPSKLKKRTPLLAGNWKMYKTGSQAASFVNELKTKCAEVKDREILVCPPAPSLHLVNEILRNSPIKLGAQNMHWEPEGAFTGELSAAMIKEAGCRYVILGHSERRQYFAETDESVNKKTLAAFKNDLTPIVCVGEILKEREQGSAFSVVERQIKNGVSGIDAAKSGQLVIAYEPVWAIGTGKTATPQQAEEMHAFIRKLLGQIYGPETAEKIRILYGGSIKPDNIDSLMAQPNIDGGLVGGASLKIEDFSRIVKFQSRT